MTIHAKFYPETQAGGFTSVDGTVQFYVRVNALLRGDMTVLDLGAGRGATQEQDSDFRRDLVSLRGKVAKLIGVDVDPVVMQNPNLDQAHVYDGANIPLPDASVDLLLSEAVFEHVTDPAPLAREMARVVKPGGWICARTPHLYSALVVGSSLIPNSLHAKVLHRVQPEGRQERDVFPTAYKMNSRRALRKLFPNDAWKDFTYTWTPEPGYHFGSPTFYRIFQVYQYVKYPILGGEFLFIFMQRRRDSLE